MTKVDIVLAGVGGQGVLTAAGLLAEAGRRAGFTVKQGEIHGMSQRGGAVTASLRMADGPVASDLIPRGAAGMILSLEPVEALRCLPYLADSGVVVTSSSPVENIPDYPPMESVLEALSRLPRSVVVDADPLAKKAGSGHANNVVMLGAASGFLPFPASLLRDVVAEYFRRRGARLEELNLKAFEAGQAAASQTA
ncbi:MAG: indolepyruvate oxidoreductase subunit beta [Gemmatimonadetes bacterium]|nr:indolepyruvate oxidoreductase subunit beta [Gemmatimonadota bacterium]